MFFLVYVIGDKPQTCLGPFNSKDEAEKWANEAAIDCAFYVLAATSPY